MMAQSNIERGRCATRAGQLTKTLALGDPGPLRPSWRRDRQWGRGKGVEYLQSERKVKRRKGMQKHGE